MTKKTKAQLLEELEAMTLAHQRLGEEYKEAEIYMRWYKNLRKKEVIVMEEEGALYLKGKDLDAYCRKITPSVSRAELLKELLPGLNALFGAEYAKYEKEIEKAIKHEYDTRSQSKETDQKDSGHYADLLRYADWDRLR